MSFRTVKRNVTRAPPPVRCPVDYSMGEEKGQGVGRVGYDAPALLTQRSHGSARHHLMGQNMPKNATNRPNSLRRPTFLETDGSHTQGGWA
jgi:hypothetical protein